MANPSGPGGGYPASQYIAIGVLVVVFIGFLMFAVPLSIGILQGSG